ncbi:hypothetical protein KA005_56200 [bacterium]|nr:hypothetical protein [bacterium]
MATNIWDAISGVAGAVGIIASSKTQSSEPAYQAEVTRTQSYGQKQGSNILVYAGMGGMALLLIMMLSRRG